MLLALSLRNFVLVEALDLDFQPGFTVLTGETGAGKSVTLDAIGLLLGDKADYGQIRHGAEEAQLSALFDLSALPAVQQLLREQGLLGEEEAELSIRRVIDRKGKSRSFLNGQAATLAQLKQVGACLIDIHGQHEHHALGSEAAQRQLLDAFAGARTEGEAVRQAWQQWQEAVRRLSEAQTRAATLAVERERLQWQCDELSALGLEAGEWETISHSHDVLSHAAELLQVADVVTQTIDGENGVQSQLYRCQQQLQSLLHVVPQFGECLALLQSVEAELGEVGNGLRSAISHVEMDEQLLQQQEARMQELMGMARKYRLNPEDLPAKLAEVEAGLAQLDADADLDALTARAEAAAAQYQTAAAALSARRRQAAAELAAQATGHMQHLAMQGAHFHIDVSDAAPSAHGSDQIQYQVAANRGMPLRPMNKVASGGELARISLALQMVTSRYAAVPTLIFDEVDTGIGGAVAEVVGKALRGLGQAHQVLAVTHLPQVAACGQQHWQVSKQSVGDSTVSNIRVLDAAERVDEVARMLGGETLTDTTRSHAAEMLALAAAAGS